MSTLSLMAAFTRTEALLAAFVILMMSQFFTNSAHTDEGAFTDAQKSQLNKMIEQYILGRPEIILKSIERMQARQKLEAKTQAANVLKERKKDLEANSNDPVMGNPAGAITMVEFLDYRCGYCKRVFPAVMKVLNENPNVRYVVKEFPILGQESVMASRASLAVWRTQKANYGAFHAALLEVRGGISEAKILDVATQLGIDANQLTKDMADPEIDRIIESNYELAQALNINGTPAFVIGGKLVRGAIDPATMNRMIADSGS